MARRAPFSVAFPRCAIGPLAGPMWPMRTLQVLREGLRLIEERERAEQAKLKALKQAARQGWTDISAARYAEVGDGQLEDFVGQLGRRAALLAKTG